MAFKLLRLAEQEPGLGKSKSTPAGASEMLKKLLDVHTTVSPRTFEKLLSSLDLYVQPLLLGSAIAVEKERVDRLEARVDRLERIVSWLLHMVAAYVMGLSLGTYQGMGGVAQQLGALKHSPPQKVSPHKKKSPIKSAQKKSPKSPQKSQTSTTHTPEPPTPKTPMPSKSVSAISATGDAFLAPFSPPLRALEKAETLYNEVMPSRAKRMLDLWNESRLLASLILVGALHALVWNTLSLFFLGSWLCD